jgi:hypothetical protein
LQPNAAANSGMFETTPLMRNEAGACSSVYAFSRNTAGELPPHQMCA